MNVGEEGFIKKDIEGYSVIKHIVQKGDLYRLLSPYESNRVALMYATPDQKEALVFSYLKRKEIYGNEQVLMLRGLDPKKRYVLKEVNKDAKRYSWLTPFEGQRFTGEFLMTHGVKFTMYQEYESAVFQLIAG